MRYFFRCFIIVLFVFLPIIGCSSYDKSEINSISTINLTVSLFDFSTETLISDSIEDDLRLGFQFIPGNIGGRASVEYLINVPLDNNDRATINLNERVFSEDTKPEVLNIEAANSGLSIDPVDTKFGRLGTIALTSLGDISDTNAFGLYDNVYRTMFYIVYFDRAAKLTGIIGNESNTSEINIEVPHAGFYAIKATSIHGKESPSLVTAINISNEIYFVIFERPDL